MTASYLREFSGGIELTVLLQPRASTNRVVGEHDSHLKIQVTAPPSDQKANEALIAFLSKVLNVPQRNVELISGLTSRRKRLRVQDIHAAAALKALMG